MYVTWLLTSSVKVRQLVQNPKDIGILRGNNTNRLGPSKGSIHSLVQCVSHTKESIHRAFQGTTLTKYRDSEVETICYETN